MPERRGNLVHHVWHHLRRLCEPVHRDDNKASPGALSQWRGIPLLLASGREPSASGTPRAPQAVDKPWKSCNQSPSSQLRPGNMPVGQGMPSRASRPARKPSVVLELREDTLQPDRSSFPDFAFPVVELLAVGQRFHRRGRPLQNGDDTRRRGGPFSPEGVDDPCTQLLTPHEVKLEMDTMAQLGLSGSKRWALGFHGWCLRHSIRDHVCVWDPGPELARNTMEGVCLRTAVVYSVSIWAHAVVWLEPQALRSSTPSFPLGFRPCLLYGRAPWQVSQNGRKSPPLALETARYLAETEMQGRVSGSLLTPPLQIEHSGHRAAEAPPRTPISPVPRESPSAQRKSPD